MSVFESVSISKSVCGCGWLCADFWREMLTFVSVSMSVFEFVCGCGCGWLCADFWRVTLTFVSQRMKTERMGASGVTMAVCGDSHTMALSEGGMLQCVAVCCSVLQGFCMGFAGVTRAVCRDSHTMALSEGSMLQCVAVCCRGVEGVLKGCCRGVAGVLQGVVEG